MSEENVTTQQTQQVRIDPNEEITEEKKLILLNQWKDKVQGEVDDYNAEKDKIYQVYKKQKEKFDKILGVKLKKMKKIDGLANNRKKVLADILKEIENLKNTKPESG